MKAIGVQLFKYWYVQLYLYIAAGWCKRVACRLRMMSQLRGSQNYVWSVTDVLGQGATGSVFKCRHKACLTLATAVLTSCLCQLFSVEILSATVIIACYSSTQICSLLTNVNQLLQNLAHEKWVTYIDVNGCHNSLDGRDQIFGCFYCTISVV